MQQIYRRTPMAKCDFNKVALQLYWNRTSAWVFSEHLYLRTPLDGCYFTLKLFYGTDLFWHNFQLNVFSKWKLVTSYSRESILYFYVLPFVNFTFSFNLHHDLSLLFLFVNQKNHIKVKVLAARKILKSFSDFFWLDCFSAGNSLNGLKNYCKGKTDLEQTF